jgi:hypothetical protein
VGSGFSLGGLNEIPMQQEAKGGGRGGRKGGGLACRKSPFWLREPSSLWRSRLSCISVTLATKFCDGGGCGSGGGDDVGSRGVRALKPLPLPATPPPRGGVPHGEGT